MPLLCKALTSAKRVVALKECTFVYTVSPYDTYMRAKPAACEILKVSPTGNSRGHQLINSLPHLVQRLRMSGAIPLLPLTT